jgi:AcrR family transcriptional regulator
MKKQTTEVRQEQIKRAVLEIIASEGLARLSTRNLAARVGISEGAIFRHFKTKQDIISGIMHDVKTDMVGGMRAAAEQDKPADKRLFELMCAQVKYILKNEGINILLFSEAAHYNDSVLKTELHGILAAQKKILIGVIQDGIKEGLWRNLISVEDAAMLYMGIPISLNMELVLNRRSVNTESFCKRMFFLFSGILAK